MLDDVFAGCLTLTAAAEDFTDGCLLPEMYPACRGIVERECVSATAARASIANAFSATL